MRPNFLPSHHLEKSESLFLSVWGIEPSSLAGRKQRVYLGHIPGPTGERNSVHVNYSATLSSVTNQRLLLPVAVFSGPGYRCTLPGPCSPPQSWCATDARTFHLPHPMQVAWHFVRQTPAMLTLCPLTLAKEIIAVPVSMCHISSNYFPKSSTNLQDQNHR